MVLAVPSLHFLNLELLQKILALRCLKLSLAHFVIWVAAISCLVWTATWVYTWPSQADL